MEEKRTVPKTALLVIDIDHFDGWSPKRIEENRERAESAVAIKKIVDERRKSGKHIIFVTLTDSNKIKGQESQLSPECYQEVPKEKMCECIGCNNSDVRLAEFLEHKHNDEFEPVFIKNEDNAFANKNLTNYLKEFTIEEIELVGCNTFACIQSTAYGALKNGFRVTLHEQGTFPSFNKNREAEKERWINEICDRASRNSIEAAREKIQIV